MFPGEDNSFENDYAVNPYESFMRKHLQHYGYYTGKNQNYKNQFHQYAEWEKNYAYDLRGSSSESESDSDDDDDKNEACSSEAEVANDHILAARARSCFGFRSTDNENDSKLQDDLLRTTQLIYSWGESGKMVPKLREPRSLYALNKELGPQQAARWPANLQVLNERVHHIQQVTSEPEPFYKTTGYEKCPMVRGENNGGQVVFNYETNASFFMKSRVGGSRNGCEQCAISLSSEDDETLIFESRFESGNLAKAVKVNDSEYELWLHYDLYTNKHTQWFYFRVSNTRANKKYRFTIVNFIKPDSLYNNGMRPVMYSKKEAALNKVGWVRGGEDIKYYRNNIRYEVNRSERNYYSMTWTATCQHDHDTVYFSHCYPYTYTDLQDYLLELSNDPIKSRICRQRVLCRTLAGNLVYVLTITSSSQNPEDIKHKKAVIVTSRVHPGESNASWMMKGFLDFVTSSSPDAKLLRDTFIIKVVPMLNPDGVIVGNYRCSLAGRDLNRNYKTSLKDAYPSVWHTKNMIRKLLQERDIIVYCDLHGHSRRQNVFIYGCEQKHNSNKRFHERIFPSMLNKNCPDKFSFNSCKFKVQKSKDGTGRVVMWNMGIMNSYTLEATFCGSSLGKKKGFHFNQHDYEMMGYHFCDTLLDYCDPDNTKYANIMVDLEHRHQMEVMAKIAEKGLEPEQMGDLSDSDVESSDGGSDSSVSDGPPVHLQFAATRTKKKRLKSKKDRDNVRPPAKEDARRGSSIQEDKRMRNNQVKPLKHDSSRNHSMRYTNSSSPRQPRTTEERSNSGVPIYVQERVDEKNQKRHDYLEALTAAYINNNIPIVNDPDSEKRPSTSPSKQLPTAELWSGGSHNCIERQKSVVHFRYSGSHPTEKPQNPQNIEGLCPRHHEQNLHAQLAAMQSNTGAPIKTGNIQEQYQRMRSPYTETNEFQLTLEDVQLQKLTPKWLLEAAFRMHPLLHVSRGDSAFKISRLVGRREARFSEGKVDDASQYHLNHTASIPPLDRRHKPHLLEVSAAQQRQTDLLSRDQNGPIKTHPNPFDEKGEKSDASCKVSTNVPKSHIPSATSYVNYNTFSVSQVRGPNPKEESGGQEEHIDHNGHRERNGRKSRRGMRDDEDNGDSAMFNEKSRPVFDIKGSSTSHTPRVKSAHSTAAMANTLSSIQELQKSLKGANTIDGSEAAASGTTTTGAGEYIQKLIKETNEEIEGLTNEIQEDIEKKHQNHHRSKHFDENGSLASPQLKGYNNKKKSASEIGKSPLGLSYHGGTFISEIGSASKSVDRVKSISGHLGGKSITQTSSASQITVSKGPSVAAKPGEYVPYTGSTFNSNINKFYGGPKLMVSTERQKETVLEEEARTRNVMRQSSLNAARNGQLPNDGTTRNPSKQLAAAPTNGKNSRHGRTDYTNPSNNPSHNNTADTDVRLYSSNGQRSNNSANSVRLTKKNLIFRTSEGTRVTTPRETYQPSDQDARGNELGDGTEKLCLPKSH